MGSKVGHGSALSLSLLVLDSKYSSVGASVLSWNSLEDVTASSCGTSRWYLWNGSKRWLGRYGGKPYGEDQAAASWRHIVCHIVAMYGHENELPDSSISLIKVSIGVFPTSLTKKSCSMTCELTVRSEGSRSNSFPNRVGWFGYWLLQYSSRAHWDFSCKLSMCGTSESPQASVKEKETL